MLDCCAEEGSWASEAGRAIGLGGCGFDQDDVLPLEEAGEIGLSKDKEPVLPVTEKPGVARQYGRPDGFSQDELGTLTREERAAKYVRDTKPDRDTELEAARGELVRLYKASPGKWPDGIDSKYDRWYNPDDWTDGGVYVGDDPCIKPLNPDRAINAPAEKVVKLSAARAALAGVEAKMGVKPVVIALETVTELAPPDEPALPSPAEVLPSPETKTRHGPKPTGKALSKAEKQRAYRERKKAEKKDGE